MYEEPWKEKIPDKVMQGPGVTSDAPKLIDKCYDNVTGVYFLYCHPHGEL